MTGTLSWQILRHLKQRKNGVHRPFLTLSTEKYHIDKVHERMCEDLYSALPELKLMSGPLRKRRGIGNLILLAIPGLITLAVKSVSSWIKGKQQKELMKLYLL